MAERLHPAIIINNNSNIIVIIITVVASVCSIYCPENEKELYVLSLWNDLLT